MERNSSSSSNICQFLEGRTLLITGATGYLAKIVLEKVLRVQPRIEKVFLLIRADNRKSCELRLQQEIMETDLFRILKKNYEENFSTFLSEKVVGVAGDISLENLGIEDSELMEQICRQVDVIINSAAITKFDERYDVAMDINTFGALNVLNFTKRCHKVKVLLHVSTAYVAKENAGVIREEPLTVTGVPSLNINDEKKILDAKLKELLEANACSKTTRWVMKELGFQRARMYGWSNTYVFTKAMGEMLLEQFKGDLEVVILRPTIVSSTCMEPFPGWIEGVRTIDSVLVSYAKGNLSCFIGDPKCILDLIPGDMVVNAILAAITSHANKNTSSSFDHLQHIYHLGSSKRNPVKYEEIRVLFHSYFTKNPWIGEDGKHVCIPEIKVLSTMKDFRNYLTGRSFFFLLVLRILNIVMLGYFKTTYTTLKRRLDSTIRLAELYQAYVFTRATFDDSNTEKLLIMSNESDLDIFNFDIKSIDWEDYVMNIHCPGAVKYIF